MPGSEARHDPAALASARRPVFLAGRFPTLAGGLLMMAGAGAAEPGPLVSAHRGGPAQMPENTMPAFENAVRLGADILEFDMNLTADDRIVIQHDTAVNPVICTADPASGVAPAPIRKLSLHDLQTFDCGAKHRPAFPAQKAVPGTPMPALDAFLAHFKDSRVLLFGETKMPPTPDGASVDPTHFVALIEALVRRYGLEGRFILQSSDYRTLDAMQAINPRIRTCLLRVDRFKPDFMALVRSHHARCLVVRAQDVDAAQVRQLRAAGVMLFSDVADSEAAWRDYLGLGVDAILTNDPAALIAFLKRDAAGE
jgi:glycerophosphoryl diester phosphodiesterase